MTTMEAWLAELEMGVERVPYHKYDPSFTEQLSATLGEDFPFPYYSTESNSSSPAEWDLDNILMADQFTHPLQNNNKNVGHESPQNKHDPKVTRTKQTGGAKRKRQPNQVQDHIIAERRRRELLSQLFISLSALVPGLKKMDKTSVLGEAITYMKQLQEKVKTLEEAVAKRAVESVVVIKKSQLVLNDDSGDDTSNSSSTVDDNCTSGCSGGGSGGAGGGNSRDEVDNVNASLPEIEVKITGNKLLLRIYCENGKGTMTNLFKELEKHDLGVTSCSVLPFENLTLDITVVAQMERGLDLNVKNFVRNLRSAIR